MKRQTFNELDDFKATTTHLRCLKRGWVGLDNVGNAHACVSFRYDIPVNNDGQISPGHVVENGQMHLFLKTGLAPEQ